MNRESIMTALAAKLSARPEFKTFSRRLKHWDDVPPTQQPALFLQQGAEQSHQATHQPRKTTMHATLYVYFRVDGDAVPGSVCNPLLDAIDAALVPDPMTRTFTLGGLVHDCRAQGATEIDEGTLDNQGCLRIPLEIITTV